MRKIILFFATTTLLLLAAMVFLFLSSKHEASGNLFAMASVFSLVMALLCCGIFIYFLILEVHRRDAVLYDFMNASKNIAKDHDDKGEYCYCARMSFGEHDDDCTQMRAARTAAQNILVTDVTKKTTKRFAVVSPSVVQR